MQKTVLILFFLFTYLYSFSQNCEYNQLVMQAYQYKKDSNFTWALQSYQEALELVDEPITSHHWALIHLYIYYNDYSKAKPHFYALFNQGVSLMQIENVLWVNDAFMASELWKELQLEYPDKRQAFYESHNIDLMIELLKMGSNLDGVWGFRAQSVSDSIIQKQYNMRLNRHIGNLRSLVHVYGWPNSAKVGVRASREAYELLNRAVVNGSHDELEWKYFHPIIREQVQLGYLAPRTYCSYVDRYYYFNFGYQLYGTWNTKEAINPIKDPEELNKRRAEFCLPTMEDFAKANGYEWPLKP